MGFRQGDSSVPREASQVHDEQTLLLEQASSADDFVESVGVQTHINYTDTPYANWLQVLSALKRLMVRHVRDALPNDAVFLKNHHDLADANIGCTCGFSIDPALTSQKIVDYVRAARDVDALEAPNECDAAANCGGGGERGAKNVAAFLPIITEAGKTLKLPVLGPSFTMDKGYQSTGLISSLITYNNLHMYFGGRNPGSEGWGGGDPQGHRYGSFEWWMDQANLNAPGKQDFVTETGYMTYRVAKGRGTIPENVEASYTPRTLLLAWFHGIKRTFLYELLDEFPDTGYGLLRHDLSAKPAFTAVSNLIRLLNDPGPSFAAEPLHLSLRGEKTPPAHMLFEKRDGSYLLVTWLEQSNYDAEANMAKPISIEMVHLSLDPKFRVTEITRFNDLGETSTVKQSRFSAERPLEVDGHLTVITLLKT